MYYTTLEGKINKIISNNNFWFILYHYNYNNIFFNLLPLVVFFNHTLPTMMGFLKGFCSMVDEKELTQMLIPVPCKKNTKKEDSILSLNKEAITLELDQNQVLKIFQLVLKYSWFNVIMWFINIVHNNIKFSRNAYAYWRCID